MLVNSITSLNDKNDARDRLLKELQKNYPDFLENLDTEKVTNEQLRDRLSEVNAQYREKIKLAAFGEMQAENQAKAVKLQKEEQERIMQIEKSRETMNLRKGKILEETVKIFQKEADYGNIAQGAAAGIQKSYNRIIDIRTQLNKLEKESLDIEKEKSKIDIGGGDKKDPNKSTDNNTDNNDGGTLRTAPILPMKRKRLKKAIRWHSERNTPK